MKRLLFFVLGILPLVTWAGNNNSTRAMNDMTMQTIKLDTPVGPLAANLYLPAGIENPPVVIVTGAWTTVKEQMPAVYAQALADQGYAAVTFDFRGWGHSPNEIRFLEDPKRKTEDIRAVIDAVSELDLIDNSHISGLGVCASSGYMLDAAVGNKHLKSVAVVAPWLDDKKMATEIYGGEESVSSLIAAAKEAQNSAEQIYIEAASLSNESALMYQTPYYTESDRGLIPEYDNQFNVASWDGWLNYDAQQSAAHLDQPVLMVASESMALPAGTHQYLANANENVDSVWFDGVSQFDFYDQPEIVGKAVTEIVRHFDNSL
ncbi:alpha/beta hydrolase [Neptuniibacter sp. QD48_11]|uniref:alpha/beta hydrolase n=1 Tax=Neptuniibacter sp. QD48_11 TaxID=3398211 RepID=UPI0039F563EA